MEALELVVLSKNVSSWSLRAYLPLAHHGIPFEEHLIPIHLPDVRERLRTLSPSGKVPVLRHGDVVVHESLAILEYLAELFPEAKLWPEDRGARALARSLASEMHAGFAELRRNLPMNLAARTQLGELDPATQREVDRIRTMVRQARARYGAGGPFLFGAFTNADAMLAPVATRFRTYGVPLDDVTAAWCEAIFAMPAFRAWESAALAAAETEPHFVGYGKTTDVPASAYVPPGPVYAVIFTSKRSEGHADYGPLAERMVALARAMPGFLGVESARGADGVGITVSYWRSLEAIAAWRAHPEHALAQEAGRTRFYEATHLAVARVETERRHGREPALRALGLGPA